MYIQCCPPEMIGKEKPYVFKHYGNYMYVEISCTLKNYFVSLPCEEILYEYKKNWFEI